MVRSWLRSAGSAFFWFEICILLFWGVFGSHFSLVVVPLCDDPTTLTFYDNLLDGMGGLWVCVYLCPVDLKRAPRGKRLW